MPTSRDSTPNCNLLRTKHVRRKQSRPGELLDAALELFVEKGFAATRAEEVAQRAGVSKGTLFLYFGSKEELFKAVVRENMVGQFASWQEKIDSFEGPSHLLLRYGMRNWWEHIGSTKLSGICKLMVSEARNFPELGNFYITEVMQPGENLIRQILERGVQRGEFRPMDMQYSVYSFVAPLIFLALRKHSFEACSANTLHIDPKQYIEAQMDTLLRGICVQPTDIETP